MKVQISNQTYTVKLTTRHAGRSYDRPVLILTGGTPGVDVIVHEDPPAVFVLCEGQPVGTADIEALGVELAEASDVEVVRLVKAGYIMPVVDRDLPARQAVR